MTAASLAADIQRRPALLPALVLLVTSLAMIAATFALRILPGSDRVTERSDIALLFAPANIPLLLGVLLASPTVGSILAIRRPRNPIGWLFLVIAIGLTLSVFSSEYVGRSVAFGRNLPGDRLVDWIGSRGATVATLLAVMWIPLLFPDGRLPGPRWRPFAWLAAAGTAGVIATEAFTKDGTHDGQRTVDAFAERLRDEVEYTEIDRDLHRVIHDAVRPAHVGVWLRSGEGADG